MQSLQSIIPGPASAALTLGRTATDYIASNPKIAALPPVSACGKKLKDGAAIAAQHVAQVAQNHPYAATAVGSGLALAAAPGLVAAPALAAAGFGSEGIVLASYAASLHSAIGAVGAGSTFATLTSAGMGGYGVAVVNGVVSGAGGAVAAMGGLAGAASWWNGSGKGEEGRKKKAEDEEEQEEEEEEKKRK